MDYGSITIGFERIFDYGPSTAAIALPTPGCSLAKTKNRQLIAALMRIIAGKHRCRILKNPKGLELRPTSDGPLKPIH